MVEKTCEVCGEIFFVKPYRAHKARFCSFACGGKWHMANRVMRGPDLTGNKLRSGLSPTNKGKPSLTKGKRLVQYGQYECSYCGKLFDIAPWIARQNNTKSGKRFCSKQCHSQYMAENESGANSSLWVGGITTYRGKGWLIARTAAVERNGGICQKCGKVIGKSIPVHHIIPFREFDAKEEANSLENLICLCQSCHMKHEKAADYLQHSESVCT